MIRRHTLCLLAFVAITAPVRADLNDGTQTSLVRVGDVDGDLRDDLLVASRDGLPEIVWLISGASGTLIREFRGETPGDAFGCALAAAGDVDKDSVPDFWIAARSRRCIHSRE